MNVEDLWIGDEVIIVSLGIRGKFTGVKNNLATIQTKDGIFQIRGVDLKIAPEIKESISLNDIESTNQSSLYEQRMSFKSAIDLHIEKLQASKKNDNPIAILEFQLRKLREFLDRAIELRMSKVDVIHGIGTGVLKMEAMNIIESYPEKTSIIPINKGGGVTVYLRY